MKTISRIINLKVLLLIMATTVPESFAWGIFGGFKLEEGSWCGNGPDTGNTIKFNKNGTLTFLYPDGYVLNGTYRVKDKTIFGNFEGAVDWQLGIDKKNEQLLFSQPGYGSSSFDKC